MNSDFNTCSILSSRFCLEHHACSSTVACGNSGDVYYGNCESLAGLPGKHFNSGAEWLTIDTVPGGTPKLKQADVGKCLAHYEEPTVTSAEECQVEEKLGEQNFRVLSEMRFLGKIWVAILDFGRVSRFFQRNLARN